MSRRIGFYLPRDTARSNERFADELAALWT